jgi:hypothetical protein
MGEHRLDSNAGRRDRGQDGLPVRPQTVRGGSSDGHSLVEQLRLARHRHPRSSRRHHDVGRGHAPRQRASMVVLAQQQHRTRRRLRPRREPHLKPNPGLNTTDVPASGLGPASPPPPHAAPSRRPHSRKARAQGMAFRAPRTCGLTRRRMPRTRSRAPAPATATASPMDRRRRLIRSGRRCSRCAVLRERA